MPLWTSCCQQPVSSCPALTQLPLLHCCTAWPGWPTLGRCTLRAARAVCCAAGVGASAILRQLAADTNRRNCSVLAAAMEGVLFSCVTHGELWSAVPCCVVLCRGVQVPAAYASELVGSLLLHIEPLLSGLSPSQLTQMVWALKQLQHKPPEVRAEAIVLLQLVVGGIFKQRLCSAVQAASCRAGRALLVLCAGCCCCGWCACACTAWWLFVGPGGCDCVCLPVCNEPACLPALPLTGFTNTPPPTCCCCLVAPVCPVVYLGPLHAALVCVAVCSDAAAAAAAAGL